MQAEDILKKYWGFNSFRPVQKDIIGSVLSGKDTLALLPTGGGKSVCFQVPALSLPGICIVISPLVALMKDQVENLAKKGIPALAIYSGMSHGEISRTLRNAAYGNYKFLYVSPERLQTSLFLDYLPEIKPSLIAVDEAHCISQWGYDFRPSYLQIAALREYLPKVPVIALTASATREVQKDICEKLLFRDHAVFQQSFERPNLSYSVHFPASKQSRLTEIIQKTQGSGIVYCRSRRNTEQLASMLNMHAISADHYHAGLGSEERDRKQKNWLGNKTRIMVCTNAFGMGIDKPDVRLVVHYDMPDCLESYYQEAGRAGRDGNRSYAVLLTSEAEIAQLREQAELRFPSPARLLEIYLALMNYLQIPAGTGIGEQFDFDLSVFSRSFSIPANEAGFALQLFAAEELVIVNENVFRPSRVVFRTTHEGIREYEAAFPETEPVIKGLLRSYEGIFDHAAPVYESALASFTGMTTEAVLSVLQRLHLNGIIHFESKKENPGILLLKNRMFADDFKIDFERIRKRKEGYLGRLEDMTRYVHESSACRSILIASRFSDLEVKACGICDNCLAKKKSPLRANDFNSLRENIRLILAAQSLNRDQLYEKLKPVDEKNFSRVIQFMLSESMLQVNQQGEFFLAG